MRVAWLTSLPSPYWTPVWDKLSEKLSLQIFFTNSENNARGWKIPVNSKWQHHTFLKRIFYLGEAQIIPSPFGFKKVCKNADVLVIGGGWEVPIHVLSMAYARLRKIDVYIVYESVLESHKFKGKFVKTIRFLVLNLATRVISVGPRSTQAILGTGIKEKKIIQLFNPVNVDFFHTISKSHKAADVFGHRFVTVAQLIERKNLTSVIEAFKITSDFQDVLTIAGDGVLRSSLEKYVSKLQFNGRVIFTGQLSQVQLAELYAESDTLILASTNEVWGMVVTESLASGCHVVVSENCGVSTFVNGMQGAYICNTTVKSIADSMQKSKNEFSGKVSNPEILQFTPERFANELIGLVTETFSLK